jgi:hypothetical protein
MLKIPRKFVKLYLNDWNNFCSGSFVSNPTNIEINLRFLSKFEIKWAASLRSLWALTKIHQCMKIDK